VAAVAVPRLVLMSLLEAEATAAAAAVERIHNAAVVLVKGYHETLEETDIP
jgi:hypothetical protein